ncbi:MAG: hypothetical protein SGBAC_010262 [Bacillariaceae sp.]
MSSGILPLASSLEPLASYALSKNVSLHILGGSVVDYAPGAFRRAASQDSTDDEPTTKPRLAAIVNAANEGCLGGGGVDGAIGAAGGVYLDRDRRALPLQPNPSGGPHVRCPTGTAVATGPGDYGSLHVPYVIHAVGPIYNQWNMFSTGGDGEEVETDPFAESNALLQSAYTSSLEVAKENDISEVAFSLLSAGVFRGQQTLEEVLSIAIRGIQDFVQKNDEGEAIVEDISLVAFSYREQKLLVQVSKNLLSPSEEPMKVSAAAVNGESDKVGATENDKEL